MASDREVLIEATLFPIRRLSLGKVGEENRSENFSRYKNGATMKNGIDGTKRDKKREKTFFCNF